MADVREIEISEAYCLGRFQGETEFVIEPEWFENYFPSYDWEIVDKVRSIKGWLFFLVGYSLENPSFVSRVIAKGRYL